MNNYIFTSRKTPANLTSIYQSRTYKGLIGLPTKQINDKIIEETKLKAKSIFKVEEIYIIMPTNTPLLLNPTMTKYIGLPMYTCIAQIQHPDPIKTITKTYSAAIFIWWQDSYALPIDKHVLVAIRNLKWENVAGEYDY